MVAAMATPRIVSFVRMSDGTVEDYRIIEENNLLTAATLPDRIIEHLRAQAFDDVSYKIDRMQHVLQTATRAELDAADDDWLTACLLHDIGDVLAPYNHGELASEIIRPFVREEVTWVVRHHGVFQRFYNKSLAEAARNSRDRFRDHPHYQTAVDFCERWDQVSFDPDYPTRSLEHFEPVLRRVFTREPFSQPTEA